MDHGEEVVGPDREAARPAVAEGDIGLLADALAQGIDGRVRQVPDHHGIGPIAQLLMTDHHPQALDGAGGHEGLNTGDHRPLLQAQCGGDGGKGPLHQGQAALNGPDQGRVTRLARAGAG